MSVEEYIVHDGNPISHKGVNAYNTNISEGAFAMYMQTLAGKNIKFYERNIKQYIKNDLHYETTLNHDGQQEIRVYTKQVLSCTRVTPKLIKMVSMKHKCAVHAFPSSSDIHNIIHTKRLIFRISNRVFINFDSYSCACDCSGVSHKIFINVNKDAGSDTEFLDQEVERLICLCKF